MVKAVFYFDGACLPVNPGGIATSGIVGVKDGRVICEKSAVISEKSTNNIAEWTAFIEALKEAKRLGITHLTVRGDSQLVVNQVNGIWEVRNDRIRQLYDEAEQLLKNFKKVKVQWVTRKKNLADAPAHRAYIEFVEKKPRQRAEQETYQITGLSENVYRVKTQKNTLYTVDLSIPSCTCPFFKRMKSYSLHKRSNIIIRCKHIFAVITAVRDGSV